MPEYKCPRCAKQMASQATLKAHLAKKVPCDPYRDKYVCTHCSGTFLDAMAFVAHLNSCAPSLRRKQAEEVDNPRTPLAYITEQRDQHVMLANLRRLLDENFPPIV